MIPTLEGAGLAPPVSSSRCSLAVLALPLVALAHVELESASPPDGAVLSEPPAEIVLTFSAELNTSKSSVTLHDPAGTQIAKGAVDPAHDTVIWRLVPPATLAPGTYEIRWTSVALDGDLLRARFISRPDGADTITDTSTDRFPDRRSFRNRLANAAAKRKSVTIAIGLARLDGRLRE